MSQKMALLLAAALTVFVVVVAGALTMRLSQSTSATVPADETIPATAAESAAPGEPDSVMQARERQYRQVLDEANGRLQQAYDRLQTLQQQIQRLQSQNTTLIERERTYEQRLQEANRLLQQIAPPTRQEYEVSGPLRQASRSASGAVREAERQREHSPFSRHHEDHDDEKERDDD